ncbi:MAG: YtxH domain-containing protein [Pedobacter sp.]
MTKETKLIAGILAGAALGVAIAVILSSDKEGDLKEKVTDWFSVLLDSSKETLSDVSDKVKDSISGLKA